jgi:hypothetical protein
MKSTLARGRQWLTDHHAIASVLRAMERATFWVWIVLRVAPIAGAAGLIAFFLLGETTAWIVAIACACVAAPISTGWCMLSEKDV